MTNVDIHRVYKVTLRQKHFNEPFTFHVMYLDVESEDGTTTITMFAEKKLTIEKDS